MESIANQNSVLSNMAKIGFILLFLQLWQFAIFSRAANHETKFPIQFKNKFYYIENSERVNWYNAEQKCRVRGGHLLNIESSEEMDVILAYLKPSERFWVSAYALAGNRDWISIATGLLMPYLRWLPGEPNNLGGNEFCVQFMGPALNDENCNSSYFYICEAKILY